MVVHNKLNFKPVPENVKPGKIKAPFVRCASCGTRFNLPLPSVFPDRNFSMAIKNTRDSDVDEIKFGCPKCGRITAIGLHVTVDIRDN